MDGEWPKVEQHYAADPQPTRDLVVPAIKTLNWPDGNVYVVLGGQTPSLLGSDTYATHISKEFAAGQFCESSSEELQWLSRYHWDHLVWLSDTVTRRGLKAPAYFACVLGHEMEHARIAAEDSATEALSILVQIAAANAKADVYFSDFPHERRCDVAGLRHAVNVYGEASVSEHLERLRGEDSNIDNLLSLLNDAHNLPLRRELMRFVDHHGLRPAMRALWESEEYSAYTQHLFAEDFE